MEKGAAFYEGKAKILYATDDIILSPRRPCE